MSYSLAISLGHNSSAVLIKDGAVLAGYEEERFTQVKSDSRFPKNALSELIRRFNLPKDTDVYVGHWFLDAALPLGPNKYWDPDFIAQSFPNGQVHSLSADFTHHDSHLESAIVFAGDDFAPAYNAIVADGFGSYGECISVYEVTGRSWKLVHRVFGFEKSLGMLYQYATAFMGMKMHNHEYKMLAYEAHIEEVMDVDEIDRMGMEILERSKVYLNSFHSLKLTNEFDPVTDLSALPNVQNFINEMLTDVLFKFGLELEDERTKRIVLSYFVQGVVEATMMAHITMYTRYADWLAVGGLFYNVKLNHLFANKIKGRLCVMPLAGDQGAALGVYNHYKGDLVWPENLYWGHRDLSKLKDVQVEGLYVTNDEAEALAWIADALTTKGWVNVVRGAMEYGPRALGNTTTLALPTEKSNIEINRANDRTMEMPMAPLMTAEQADRLFYDVDKVHKSLEYMIVARMYDNGQVDSVKGAAHYYSRDKVSTGRPQITNDPFLVSLLESFGPLINTSFNYHGVPIVNTPEQIVQSHEAQWKSAPDLAPLTVVLLDK